MNKSQLQQVLTALTGGHTSLGLSADGLKQYRAAVDCLEAAIAQPEQEPVAWMIEYSDMPIFESAKTIDDEQKTRWTPLYASPPIVSLSDEAISEIAVSIVRGACELEISKPFEFADDELIVTVDELKLICINEIKAALLKKAGA